MGIGASHPGDRLTVLGSEEGMVQTFLGLWSLWVWLSLYAPHTYMSVTLHA